MAKVASVVAILLVALETSLSIVLFLKPHGFMSLNHVGLVLFVSWLVPVYWSEMQNLNFKVFTSQNFSACQP